MEKFISEFDENDQDFAKKIYSVVKDFVNDNSKQEFHFTKKLTSANRRIVHALADRMKLRHISQVIIFSLFSLLKNSSKFYQ